MTNNIKKNIIYNKVSFIKVKKAFTLVELIVAVTISAIILLFLMSFIADTFNEIAYSNKKTKLLINLYEVEDRFKTLKQQYLSGIILKDNIEWVWSDIILLRTLPTEPIQWWYIFAQVEEDTLRIDNSSNVNTISKKVLGYRKISSSELLALNSTNVYDLKFNLDEIFPNIYLKDFQVELYNSWTIIQISLHVNLDYNIELNWWKYSNIWNESIEKIIFNF